MGLFNYNITRIYSNNIWFETINPLDRYKRFFGWKNDVYNPKSTLATRNKEYGQKEVFYDENNKLNIMKKNKLFYNVSIYGKNDNVDTVVFYDEYKGRRRLNIDAHGALDENYFRDKGGRMVVEGEYYDGDDLALIVRGLGRSAPFDCVRLLTCRSGEGGDDSLISKLSSALKVPVKGYEGKVLGYYNMDDVSRYKKNYGTEATQRMLVKDQLLGRNSLVNEVSKGSVRYERHAKTVMAGMEFF